MFGRKRLKRAFEVLRLHANGLRLGFGFDGLLDRHRPLLLQHGFGHAVGKGWAHRQVFRHGLRFGEQVCRFNQTVEKAPSQAFLRRHGAAGEQQFRRSALPDDAGQQRASAHVRPRQADAGEQKRGFGFLGAIAQVASQRHHRARAGADAVYRADDGLRAVAHGFDQIAGHAGEFQHLGHAHFGERADDFKHIATAAKVAACAGDDDGFDVCGVLQVAKQVAQLGVGVKSQRVFALWAVQGDRSDAALFVDLFVAPCEMGGVVVGFGVELLAHRVGWADKMLHDEMLSKSAV